MPTSKANMDTQEKLRKKAVDDLRVIGGQLTKDDEVTFQGTQYVFPEQYRGNLPGLAEDVVRYVRSQSEPVVVSKTFNYRPMDGAYATAQCLKKFFGYASSKGRPTPFGLEPPKELTIDVGYVNGKLIQETVPWGDMVLPGIPEGTLTMTIDHTNNGPLFKLNATVRKMDKPAIDGFYLCVDEYLAENSIYRGKAIMGDMSFIDVDKIHPEDFVYSKEVWANAEVNFLSPLRDRDEIAANRLSSKRVTLLEGPFGTGKTGLLRTALKTAVANGATAIMCRPGYDDPMQVLSTAILYAGDTGVVVCIEDIDIQARDRDPQIVSRLLDVFDGPTTKGLPITVVMTTNHVETIHKGMLRSGRIDAVMHIGEMDRPGVEKLTRLVLGDHLDVDVDFDAVYEATDGFMPAYVKEGLERALRYTIADTGKAGAIETEHLVFALNSLRPQYDLQAKASDKMRELPMLDAVFTERIQEAVGDVEEMVRVAVEDKVNGAQVALENQDNGHKLIGQIQTP